MTRYYFGSITGKFWAGLNDISLLGGKPENVYEFCGCNCIITEEEMEVFNDKELAYCLHCYSSYKDHLSNVNIESEDENVDESLDESEEPIQLWSISPHFEFFRFTEKDTEILYKNLDVLEKSVGEFMTFYKIIDNNEIEYDYELPRDIDSREVAEMIYLLCLGRQIKFCIEKNKKCDFTVEL